MEPLHQHPGHPHPYPGLHGWRGSRCCHLYRRGAGGDYAGWVLHPPVPGSGSSGWVGTTQTKVTIAQDISISDKTVPGI